MQKVLCLLCLVIFSLACVGVSFASDTHTCTPEDVATFSSRIHVKCDSPFKSIEYFAVSTSDENETARFLSIISLAFALQKEIKIWFDQSDTSGDSIGCLSSDCRLMTGVKVMD